MAINHPQPPSINGAVYPFLDASMALSTRDDGNGSLALSMVVNLTPYRVTDNGIELLEEGRKVFVWGDALAQAQDDPRLAHFLAAIQAAGQQFVNEAF